MGTTRRNSRGRGLAAALGLAIVATACSTVSPEEMDTTLASLRTEMIEEMEQRDQQVSQQLEEHFGDKVYRTLVPRNVRLAEAPSYGVPAVCWDAASKGAQAYLALASEILGEEQPA